MTISTRLRAIDLSLFLDRLLWNKTAAARLIGA
jgi:hypothetical protein